ncbi:MAG: TraM recognition domain-containing protein [Microlunatus sp.]|nr:TraM recognition domain-containing protein [Microlunatus sp.]
MAGQVHELDDRVMAVGIIGVGLIWGVLFCGAWVSAVLSGGLAPDPSLTPPFIALAHPGSPGTAWGQPVGPPVLYWTATVAVAALPVTVWLLLRRLRAPEEAAVSGCASGSQVAAVAGARALRSRGSALRPSLPSPRPVDLGYRLGASRGRDCYASVEDSIVVLGPPRSGKGLHLIIPTILDAPGAVLTTSTRPDNLTVTMARRATRGRVAVFDPQHLAPGVPSATRWSPIRGCQDPHIAMVRAKALTANTAAGTSDSTFWQASAEQAVRCLLHAAALGGHSSSDLYRWSLSSVQAREAVMILATHARAAASWHEALDAIVSSDPRQRDAVWAMVTLGAALADPRVLDAVSPGPGEGFDPEDFLRSNGTVYLLGTSTGVAATAGLVGAFVEDVIEAARRLAARSAVSRLDPPLSLVLDEAANYPMPSLPSLMSDGGGSGISTLVVLQSLAQARAVWGEHAASAIWDAAIVKAILGGGSNTCDRDALEAIIRGAYTTEAGHPAPRSAVTEET